MKAIYLEKNAGVESWVAGEIPRPQPKVGEVLVKVVHRLKKLPPSCRADSNANAFRGGFRLWENAPTRGNADTSVTRFGKRRETKLAMA